MLRALVTGVSVGSLHIGRLGTFIVPGSHAMIRKNGLDTRVVVTTISAAGHPIVCINNGRVRSSGNVCRVVYKQANSFALRKCVRVPSKHNRVIHHSFSRPCSMMIPSTAISTSLVGILCTKCRGPVDISVPNIPTGGIITSVDNNILRPIKTKGCVTHPASINGSTIVAIDTGLRKHVRRVKRFAFHIHGLPSPATCVRCTTRKNDGHFHNKHLSGRILVNAGNVNTTVSSNLLGVRFHMRNFRAIFFSGVNGTIPTMSGDDSFARRRHAVFHSLKHNGQFCVSHVRTMNPSKIRHALSNSVRIVIGWGVSGRRRWVWERCRSRAFIIYFVKVNINNTAQYATYPRGDRASQGKIYQRGDRWNNSTISHNSKGT